MTFVLPAAAAGRSAGFDVLRDLPWWGAWWAGDPDWTHPTDGSAVASWRDGTGSGHPATQATGTAQPLWVASAVNSLPAVRFDGTDDVLATGSFSPSKTQPLTWVAVATFAATPTTTRRIMGTGGNTARGFGSQGAGGNWAMNFTTAVTAGTVDTSPHLIHVVANGASSVLYVDGTSAAAGDTGTGGMAFVSLGAGSTSGPAYNFYWAGDIAFAGIARGDITSLGVFDDLKSWASDTYGLTVA